MLRRLVRDREHILVFFRKFWVVSVCFETVYFDWFASIGKKWVSLLWLNRNKQKTNWNILNGSRFWYFKENFCLSRLFRYRFETPKQTETNQNWPKQTGIFCCCTKQNRLCLGLFGFEPKFFLVSRTPYHQLHHNSYPLFFSYFFIYVFLVT